MALAAFDPTARECAMTLWMVHEAERRAGRPVGSAKPQPGLLTFVRLYLVAAWQHDNDELAEHLKERAIECVRFE